MNADDLDRLRQKALACEELGIPDLDRLNPQPVESAFYRFLYFLAQELQPDLCVELGVETGRGAAHLAAAYPPGQVLAVDPQVHGGMIATLAPYVNVEFIQMSSDDPSLLARIEQGSVDMCFVDSVHAGDYTLREVELWTPKMKVGGLFLFDDLTLNSSMQGVLPGLPFAEKGLLDGLHTFLNAGFGYALVAGEMREDDG